MNIDGFEFRDVVLDEREWEIIKSRFGEKRKTLAEIGKKLGVGRERVRQLQNVALSKLRREASNKA